MTEEELQRRLDDALPAGERHGVFVEEVGDQDVRLRFEMPAGRGWSDAALLAVVDTSLRAAAALGAAAGLEARLTHLSLTRLKPPQEAEIVAIARVIRRDRGTVHAEAWLFSHAVIDAMAHATASLRADG